MLPRLCLLTLLALCSSTDRAAVQALISELQSGALRYGDFGKRRIELYEKVNRDIEKVRQSILPAKPTSLTKDKK